MNSSSHCNISLCELSPESCVTHLTEIQWVQINLIVCLPLLLVFIAPILASRSQCQRDDDVWSRKSLIPSVRMRETDRSELPRANDDPTIDPAMFCCGLGAPPSQAHLPALH